MLVKDYATLEAVIDKGEPSRLLIEIALRPASLAGPWPPTTRAKSSARFATGSGRFWRRSSSSGSPGRRSCRNR